MFDMSGFKRRHVRAFLLLLLVLSLVPFGGRTAGAAMAGQTPTPVMASMKSALSCPDAHRCGGDTVARDACGLVFCWTASAVVPSPIGSAALYAAATFSLPPHSIRRGVSVGPDPHPPRSSLRS
jgi:hypothetical protein